MGNVIVKYKSKKINLNILVFGIDENYLEVKGYEVKYGWNFSFLEVINGGYWVIIVFNIVDDLFEGKDEKVLD